MLLTVKDRLILLQLLADTQGDLTTLKLVRTLREELSFDEMEHAALNMVVSEGRVTWEPGVELEKEVEVGPRMQVFLLDKLKGLDQRKELRLELLDVCDKLGYGDAG